MVNPKKKQSLTTSILKEIEDRINENPLVNVIDLKQGGTEAFIHLKESEQDKVKMYCCVVATEDEISDEKIQEINELSDLEMIQKTPLRVLHRRTLMNRSKMIHKVKVFKVNPQSYVVFVLSSAGTYIKEFIHGDLERTLPNFGTLAGTKADIYQLDVVDIFKQLDEASLKKFEDYCNQLYF